MRKILLLFLLGICFYGLVANASTFQENTYKEVMVEENQTLWDIAIYNIDSSKDVRKYIYEVQKLNGINDPGELIPGRIIKLPK